MKKLIFPFVSLLLIISTKAYSSCTAPTLTVGLTTQTICAGQSATLSVQVNPWGNTLSYTWKREGVDLPETGSSINITNASKSDSGGYQVTVWSGCGNLYSSAPLIVLPTTTIISQSADKALCVNDAQSIYVQAQGDNLTYQWKKDGNDISNATNSQYSFGFSSAMVGNYSVLVTGTCGAKTSNPIKLSELLAPSIEIQPASQSICVGNKVEFAVTCTGDGLTYQWMKNNTDISGATSAKYNMSAVTSNNAGNYAVKITGTCGQPVTSGTASLTVSEALTIKQQPTSQSTCAGKNLSFKVYALGLNLTYQWKKNGVDIVGALKDNYTVTPAFGDNGSKYSVLVSGCGSSIASNDAVLSVDEPVSITTQPLNVEKCLGEAAKFAVTASGSGLAYQWYKNTTAITADANAAEYSFSAVAITDTAHYSVMVSNRCGSVTSNNVVLMANTPTSIKTQPSDQTICVGGTATFTTVASGTGLTYLWKKGTTTISGATSAIYSKAQTTLDDVGNYSVVVSGNCGSPVTSSTVSLVINNPTVISTQPSDISICPDSSARFTVSATGSGITYQWQIQTLGSYSDINSDDLFKNYNTAQLLIPKVTADIKNAKFKCKITGLCGDPVLSEGKGITLYTTTMPGITQTGVMYECTQNEVSLTADKDYSSYKWSPGNATTKTIKTTTPGNYTLIATDANGCATKSAEFTLKTVIFKPQICMIAAENATGNNLIVWERVPNMKITKYNVYKQGDQTGTWILMSSPKYTDLGVYEDMNSNTKKHAEIYKLTATNECGAENPRDSVKYHRTIFLQYVPSQQGVNLIWDPYIVQDGNFDFNHYEILSGTDSTKLTVLQQVDASVTKFTDTRPQALSTRMYYKVAAVKLTQCTPTASTKAGSGPFSYSVSNLENNNRLKFDNGIRSTNFNLSNIYPNPSKDIVNLDINVLKPTELTIELYNQLGSRIKVQKAYLTNDDKNYSLSIKDLNLKDGYYILLLSDGASRRSYSLGVVK
jgi:hypothetical protein